MKKRKFIYAVSALLLLGAPLALASCGGNTPTPQPTPNPNPNPGEGKVKDFSVSLSSEKAIYTGEQVTIVATSLTEGVTGEFIFDVTSGSEFISVNDNGVVTGLSKGKGVVTVKCRNGADDLKDKTVEIECLGQPENAVGPYNYVASSYEEKLQILGKLEKYAVDKHLTGITLFQNGGYVAYSSRVKLPTTKYITGYGLGVLSEGSITTPLTTKEESNPEWQMYYHGFGGTANKQKFNYLDDTGSESADLYGYVSSGYYSTKMNSTKDGYEWYPVLAKTNPVTGDFRPQALNKNEATGLATQYKVYLRTGKDGLKYNTLGKYKEKGYAGRDVQLEDYVTPYRLLLNQKIGLARSADMISDSSNSTLKGAKAYYSQTKDNSNIKETADIFDKLVGIKTNKEENSITFTFNTPVNQFSAMTNLSGSLYSPIPADFIYEIGKGSKGWTEKDAYYYGMKKTYGTVNSDNGSKPVDNLLSVAPYVLEGSDNTYNVYKRNPLWYEFSSSDESIKNRYSIEGIKLVYLQGASSDKNAAFLAYENGGLDACAIPKDFIAKYQNKEGTTKTEGDSTFKLNLNTCTQEEWEAIFGTKGTNPNGGQTWKCKPLMSNDNFINALSFSIDRETFASTRGNIASQSYFAPAYLWEPEKGKSYDETDEHKAAIANYSPETVGYNEELAVQLFDKAIAEEVRADKYDWNSKETIKINWMNTTDRDDFGNEIVQYFNNAFKKTNAYKNGFRLEFLQEDGTQDYQQVYNKMKAGTFDIGFGSISGMQTDPLGFLEVMKSNNSTGFTLNYGCDTSIVDESDNNYILFDGKKWSFDSLWTAANKGAIVGGTSTKGKVIEKPVVLKQKGNASIDAEVNSVKYRQLAIQLAKDTQAVATETKFKVFASKEKEGDDYITVNINYNEGTTPKVAVYNIAFGSDFIQYGNGIDKSTGEITGNDGILYILIPEIISSATTDGQINETILYKNVKSMSVYVSYYMEINNVPTATTLDMTLIDSLKK